jgi:ribosomal protein S25
VTDFLDEKRKEISNRLRELKPAVDEYNRLEAAASALANVRGSASASATPKRRGPGRPRGSGTRAKAARATTATKAKRKKPGRPPGRRRAGRRKGSGTRAAQALSFVQGQPGITIPELAAKMGIKQNYLYRVLPGLEQEGKVKKQGRGWLPRG